jgi:hypothetical protein
MSVLEKFREEKNRFYQLDYVKDTACCMGFSLLWIREHRNQDDHSQIESLKKLGGSALRIQMAYQAASSRSDGLVDNDVKLRACLPGAATDLLPDMILGDTSLESGDSVSKVISDYVDKNRTYNIISLVDPHKAVHAVACYKSGGKLGFWTHLYLFDPNFGELKCERSKIKELISGLLDEYEKDKLFFTTLGATEVTFKN